ncbi:Putative aliphatic sulfonates transport permease protein SsuC [Aquimixticola soesokkakensis]|uniref:Putative aliphatic sulfonates transport permease protein SsuC n=1 Tax=Aquimixticola soesokkakensis TaxID=1519096 RepID=A0A1Y5RTK0_9RHOB|nr:ABC transporter permease [Aquimixticola soesokkakensis]SLN25257.1 Putative aliphatic sulfonates transport permease protein SsuC [Aquimixticola soesokkakensis]
MRALIIPVLSLCALLAFWAGLAALKGDADVLPAPNEVLAVLIEEARSDRLWRHLWATLARVSVAFVLAMGLGTALGIALGRVAWLDRITGPWVVVFLNMPALVVIVLCYLWIGLNEVAAITAVTLNKTAMVLVTMREGVRAREADFDDLARVYRLSLWARLRHVTLPQLAPFALSAARTGIAVIWKIVLVVEFLGRSSGVGFAIHLHFQLFQTAHVMAYALSFVAVMLAVERLVFVPWERHALRWRRVAG